MNQHVSTEQMRQSQHYREVRARLFNAGRKLEAPVQQQEAEPAAPPAPAQILYVRDCDAHVIAWRHWLQFKELITGTTTCGTFAVAVDPVQNAAAVTLQDNADEIELRRPMKDICLDVLQDFPGVTLDEVRGRHRQRHIVAARQACMYAIYTERKDISFPRLGNFFGGRDHTTALYSVKLVEARKGDALAAEWCRHRSKRVNEDHKRNALRKIDMENAQ
ncbi:helix-turn-helix domain-containing protein [Ensifer adhaerens]|uniref:helix-turn-helix domain-containing protein n=1 Tax=Ensifer adhaerens TaxID=106592 RepID=UPI00384C3AE6